MTTDGGVVYAIVSNIPSSAARVWSTGFPLRKRCHRRRWSICYHHARFTTVAWF